MIIESSFIDKLPDDLLRKILCHLPCKSAVQCKAVYKRWLFIISDPHFVQLSINKHHQIHRQSYKCLEFVIQGWCYRQPYGPRHGPRHRRYHMVSVEILKSITTIPDFKYRLKNKPDLFKFVPCFGEKDIDKIYVKACFNDLLVCCHLEVYPRIFYIINPITKEWLKLPAAPNLYSHFKVGFVYYPSCRDKKQAKFKLVRLILRFNPPHCLHVEIFCSETGKWRQLAVSYSPEYGQLFIPDIAIVACNGILHWVNPIKGINIVAFDPTDNVERCRIIDPPVDSNPDVRIECLGVCRGRLRISKFNGLNPSIHGGKNNLTVWELVDYYEGKWQLEYNDGVNDMEAETLALYNARLMAFHPFDADIVYLSLLEHLVSYNMRSRKLTELEDRPPFPDFPTVDPANFFLFVHSWWPTPIPNIVGI